MKFDLDELSGTITLDAPMTAAVRVKEIPGARHDAKARVWRFPVSWATCVVARGVFGQELEVGESLAAWATAEGRDRILPANALREALDAAGRGELYPYQRVGVQFLATAGSALMSDEMGLGKTVQTITALEELNAYPALIVAPNSVKAVWEREFKKWTLYRRVAVAGSGAVSAAKAIQAVADGEADVLVINWEAIRRASRLAGYGNERLAACKRCDATSTMKNDDQCERHDKPLNLIPWQAVVADEAHRAKSPKAKQTRALWALGDRAPHRFALTGTPIANSPADLWSIMRFVAPAEFPAKWPWLERYGQLVPNIFSGGSDVVGFRTDRREEFDRYFLPRFLRRTKAQVLTDLPPKTYERRDIKLTGKQLKAYDSMKREMLAAVEGGTTAATEVLTQMIRLQQLASAYAELTPEGKPILSEPSTKLDALEEVLEDLGGKKAVVFAASSQLIELAYARLLKTREDVGFIIGAVPTEKRGELVEKFQETDEVNVLLLTVGAGGEGITLTAADTAIFLQRPWSAVLNAQAEDRLHRIGQEAENVTYIDLVTTDTIEEKVFDALAAKAGKLEELVRDEQALAWYLKMMEGQ